MSETTPGMPETPSGAVLNFSSAALPERERIAIFREFIARKLMRVDIEPVADHPFDVDVAVRNWPGLDFIYARRSPLTVARTKSLLSDGDDRLVFQLDDFPSVVNYARGEFALDAGDAILTSNGDAVYRTFPSPGEVTSLFLSRRSLAPLLRDGESGFGRPIPSQTPVLRLIRSVLTTLRDEAALATPEIQALTINYVYDLVAVAIGATRDAAQEARGRGLRMAQFLSIKRYVEEHLPCSNLSPDVLAPRFGMSGRSIQRLFEQDGTTFTEFLRERRLQRVHRMLSSPRFERMTVTEIALASGFGELSHFNRHFRARFGMSPREVRKRRN